MRNDVWNDMDRIYTKKFSEKHFWTKIADRNNEICSLVRSVKKLQKMQTDILKCRITIFRAESANLQF
jgi:hypothetical protein